MSTDPLHEDAVATLRSWHTDDPQQNALRHTMLAFLDARADACLRACAPGHLTASAVVVDAARTHVLLTLHPRVGSWIQLGGHCEPHDTSLRAAAFREATEESGLDDLCVCAEPVALHTHPITCSLGRPTRHLDVRFLAVAPVTGDGRPPTPVRSDESVDLRWWPVDALPDDQHTREMSDLVRRALAASPS